MFVILRFFLAFIIFVVMASLFFSLFMFGGIFAPLLIVFYMYYLIYKKIQCFNKDAFDIEDESCENFLDQII